MLMSLVNSNYKSMKIQQSTHLGRALVLGNGESRSWFKPSKYVNHPSFINQCTGESKIVTWGCNAIHRDGHVDNLVSIDYGIQQEVYQSGYHKKSQCWFADWNPVPAEIADMMFMGFDIPESYIHRTEKKGYHTEQCVIAGTDPATLHEKVEVVIKQFPDLDMADVKLKLGKDIGVWITYVDDSDTIKDIDFPKRWSAGTTAIHLACQGGAEEVYMLGFDLSSPDKLINNIYKGTEYYYPEHTKGFSPVNWINQLGVIFNEFPETQFYWVDFENKGVFLEKNLGFLTKDELCDKLNIL